MRSLLIIILLFPSLVFGAYGDGIYGDVIYGDTPGGAIDVSIALELQATLAQGVNVDRQGLINLLVDVSQSHSNSVIFVKALTLSAVSSLSHSAQLDTHTALSLNTVIAQSHIGTINTDALLTLASQLSQSYGAVIDIDASVVLQAVGGVLFTGSLAREGSISLQSQTGMTNLASSVREGVIILTAHGDISEAAQLIVLGALLLQAEAQYATINNVEMQTLISLASTMSQIVSVAGLTYDTELVLSAVSNVLLGNQTEMTGAISLPVQATVNQAISLTREGIFELIAQGNIVTAAQLLVNTAVILNASSAVTMTSTVDWHVLLNLSTRAEELFGAGGMSYDTELSLAVAASVVTSAALTINTDISLTVQATMDILASLIREGVIALNTRTDYVTASQLTALGIILLNSIATDTEGVTGTYNVEILISAIARAVLTGDTGELAEIVGRRIFIKDNAARDFIKDINRRILNVH
jgi:hypothetical protein